MRHIRTNSDVAGAMLIMVHRSVARPMPNRDRWSGPGDAHKKLTADMAVQVGIVLTLAVAGAHDAAASPSRTGRKG
ncbi:hypothetical protein [Rhodococcoides fascians]|uniref:hypothetical protein n=1 Tax=Rhodococcoides fascians TaxID=1828 RepID=UPI000B9C6F91|nr:MULTISPECIES: hypothetical protein [Rhodococcus]OZF05578.1 hypothetical protein CH301_04100 [Rhodococcus sp. 15-1189-1-1a]